MKIRIILFLLSILLCVCPCYAEQAGRPVVVRDLFPFSAMVPGLDSNNLQFSQQELAVELASGWSNTINGKSDRFLIDVETRLLEPKVTYRVDENSNLSLALPWYWRGGGVLDESIYQWHEFFGLPQGPRDGQSGRDNRFLIKARNDSGEFIELTKQGYGIGDLNFNYNYKLAQFSERNHGQLQMGLLLPTSRSEYGLEGLALSLGLSQTYRGSFYSLYAIGQYSYLSDPWVGEFKLRNHLFASLLGVEFPFESCALQLLLTYQSDLLQNIPSFPVYQLYLDAVIVIDVADYTSFQLVIRENPGPDTGSADISGYLNLVFRQ